MGLRGPRFSSARSQTTDKPECKDKTSATIKRVKKDAFTTHLRLLSRCGETAVSLALCQDKLSSNQGDKATGGKEAAVTTHRTLKAHRWQVTFPLPPPPSVPVMLLGGAWQVTVKFSFSLLAPAKGGTSLSLRPRSCYARGSLESDVRPTPGATCVLKMPLQPGPGGSLAAKGRFWQAPRCTAISLPCPHICSSERPAREDRMIMCSPDPNLGQAGSSS